MPKQQNAPVARAWVVETWDEQRKRWEATMSTVPSRRQAYQEMRLWREEGERCRVREYRRVER